MIISGEYYRKEKVVKLTQSEVDIIIDELKRTEHNIFEFLNYNKIIEKLEKSKLK